MSGASEAVAALQGAAKAAFQSAFDAGSAFGRSHSAVRQASDLVDVFRAMIDLTVAAEGLHHAADLAVASLREALSAEMEATGCTQVQGTAVNAHLSRKPQFLSVENPDLIPREYYVTPAPTLDKKAVISALRDGIQIEGVSLMTPNRMSLVLRSRKETTTP
jgi:hypothetical protein